MAETVSIVIAAKNSLPALMSMIEATMHLSLESTDLVVVDGGSTDGTARWLQSVVPDGRSGGVSWESVADSGIAEAWNRGIRLARGQWVVFLGVDDHVADAATWRSAVDRLGSLPPECGVAAFPVRMVTSGGTIVADEAPRLGAGGGTFPSVNAVPHQGAFHRRSLWGVHGDFDTSFAIAADYEFLLRIWSAGVEIRACSGSPPVSMTFGGTSKRSPLINVREFGRARRKHGIRVSPLHRCREWAFAALRSGLAAVVGDSLARRLADCGRRIRGLPPVWSVR